MVLSRKPLTIFWKIKIGHLAYHLNIISINIVDLKSTSKL